MRIGKGELTPVIELERVVFPIATSFGADQRESARREAHWTAPRHYDSATEGIFLSHHSWPVTIGGRRILIDPWVGNGKLRPAIPAYDHLDTPWLDRLAKAGATPADIDFVFCAQIHPDHCGWNTRLENGRWVPTFPNAPYFFSRTEYEFRRTADFRSGHPGITVNAGVFADSVQPVLETGQAVLLDGRSEIAGCLDTMPAPGHSPGHLRATLISGGDDVVFAGDALHHPLQLLYPGWNNRARSDPAEAEQTRREILGLCAESDHALAPAHFMPPHVFGVECHGEAFRPVERI